MPECALLHLKNSTSLQLTPSSYLKKQFSQQIFYPVKLLSQKKYKLYHILDHSSAALLKYLPKKAKKIVTVHDIIPLKEEGGLSKKQRKRFEKRVSWLHQADLILSDSLATKKDLIELLNIPPNKIELLYLGVDESFFAPHPSPPPALQAFLNIDNSESSSPSLLAVGSCAPRKNLEILPKILPSLLATFPNLKLIRVGSSLPEELKKAILKYLPSQQLIELGFIEEKELPSIYAAATVYFFPSFFEGYGLPVLESMAAGCPVVCSNRTSIPEVGGGAALYFDPDKPAEAIESLNQVLGNENKRKELVRKGTQQALESNWKKHVLSLQKHYEKLLKPS